MLVWGMALLSLLMPIAGVVLALYGAFKGFSGSALGWVWLVAGIAILVADLFIDERWSYWMHPGETDLNRRGMQLLGQVAAVTAAIPAGGRGSVSIGDTVWVAEGAEAAVGAKVRITGCKGTVLTVEAV